MSLSNSVLDYIDRVKRSPVRGSDPGELAELQRAALDSLDGRFAAYHAPISALTWEVRTLLPGASAQTDRVVFKFPYNCEVLAFRPCVVRTSAGALIVPGLDDLDVQVDLNNSVNVTSALGVTTPAATARDGAFVSLGNLSINAPRLLRLKLTGVAPEIGFTFRWKRGAAVYEDVLVAMGIFAVPTQKMG